MIVRSTLALRWIGSLLIDLLFSDSQAVDVGTVKSVSAEAIRLLLWILGFMTFGYGTAEFEVTTERLGAYRANFFPDPLNYHSLISSNQARKSTLTIRRVRLLGTCKTRFGC